ncbi:methyltransferase domain-containing protein [Massilia sp. W12]|uniref:putative RNA methyltransferase n=1 Tax=Massilia sp. W12 TaxID=3126507 RepID=UPI0030D06E0A
MLAVEFLRCPVCQSALADAPGKLSCDKQHAFDIAKEGYCNLLRGKSRGDTKEMLQARRTFLDAGHYALLSSALNAMAGKALAHDAAGALLDLGCGEGYYLGRLHAHLLQQGRNLSALGADISKEAIKMAAKRHQTLSFVVADINQTLPFQSGCASLILNIFAPRNPAEFHRLLAAHGHLLVTIPGDAHLQELRDMLGLLDIEADKAEKVKAKLAPWFDALEEQEIVARARLHGADLLALATMTPNGWHVTDEHTQRLLASPELEVTFSFRCLRFQRRTQAAAV